MIGIALLFERVPDLNVHPTAQARIEAMFQSSASHS
jgi:hypothetical protein